MPTLNEVVRAIIADPTGMASQFPVADPPVYKPTWAEYLRAIAITPFDENSVMSRLLHENQFLAESRNSYNSPMRGIPYGDGPMSPFSQIQDDYVGELEREGRFYLDAAGD